MADKTDSRAKDKNFAAKVSRADIELGISELAIDKDAHIQFVIDALKPIQNQIYAKF